MFQPGEWYKGLDKPAWTPPNWVFPVVWTSLYLLISFAAMRVAMIADSGQALAFFALQAALSTLWTPVFFGLRKMRAAFMVIICLWVAVAATLISFWQVDWLAGLTFAPLLVWVSIATALNFSVWKRNPGEA
jgi:tryptophan-rich sensory protein